MKFNEAAMSLIIISIIILSGCLSPEKTESRDTSPPEVDLISPENNSFIVPGEMLEFSVKDEALNAVLFCVDNDSWNPFNPPYRINTEGWDEGEHVVRIRASDSSNNNITSIYLFKIDLTPPSISLLSPPNNSAMESGTQIVLNISDRNLLGANYSLDGGKPQCLPRPFIISTEWWTEGTHTLEVRALDKAMNSALAAFTFKIDNKETSIKLISPSSRVIRSGTPIVFSIEEITLLNISYSINGGEAVPWSAPWTIQTDGWKDGTYSITIMATDEAGHGVIRTYRIDIDDTPPSIDTPELENITVDVYLDVRNYSSWKERNEIKINVSDAHIENVMYSLNGGEFRPLESPYLIDPTVWRGKIAHITVRAVDVVGNEAEISFNINLSFNLTIYMGKGWSEISIPFFLADYLFSLPPSYGEYLPPSNQTDAQNISDVLKEAFKAHGIVLSNSTIIKTIDMVYWEYEIVDIDNSTRYWVENTTERLNIFLFNNRIREAFECINKTENGSYSVIYSYNDAWNPVKFDVTRPDKFNSLRTIPMTKGLEINIGSNIANFTISGILPSNLTLHLRNNLFNFVSYPSMNPMRVDRALQGIPWYRVQRWDWETKSYVDMRGDDLMLPGHGYWIYVSYECDWLVDF